jgi:putative redox protein
MEVLLMSLAGCSSIDVISILKKMKQEVTDYDVEVMAERKDEVPSIFTKIHMNFIVKGNDLNKDKVQRAVQLSAEKYCSVSKTFDKMVAIQYKVFVNAS